MTSLDFPHLTGAELGLFSSGFTWLNFGTSLLKRKAQKMSEKRTVSILVRLLRRSSRE